MTTDYLAERTRVDHLRQAIVRALSGRDTLALLDYEPTSRYCVGILTPTPAEDQTADPIRALRRTRRKPDALGFAARVQPENGRIAGSLTAHFALYYRQVPAFDEQRPAEGDPETSGRLRQKYARVDVEVTDLPLEVDLPSGATNVVIDLAAANARLHEHLSAVVAGIGADRSCWPGKQGNLSVHRGALASAEQYAAALPKGSPALPVWQPVLRGDLTTTGDGWRLSLWLQNRTDPANDTQHPEELFDAGVALQLSCGRLVAEPFAAAELDYRYGSRSWGRGNNAVLEVGDDGRSAWTETLPVYEQPRTRSRGTTDACRPETLAGPETLAALEALARQLDDEAERWATANVPFVADPTFAAREQDLARFAQEIARFRAGIDALRHDTRLLRAFRLMNDAARTRHVGNRMTAWRLFQVVFIVSIAPSLLAREQRDDDALRRELEQVDVLWFPTGGGKTEAYFGVILMAMFYDRLRGKTRGTTAWLRYPLRMLSIQQLQRLIEFVAAAEDLRAASGLEGDPFWVGYYVGSSNTPNELTWRSAPHAIERLAASAAQHDGDVIDLHVLQRCPYCGATQPRVEVDADTAVVRLYHRCRNDACRRIAPIYLSDSEIYRYAPTVLVGTVDRLARAGQTDLFSHIFGQFNMICPQHGYTSFGSCVEPACTCKPATFQPIAPIYDPIPALLLQDELHLLKESLGTYDAHFEGFLDAAARRFGTRLPSKRLAATATIEGYGQHVREIYGNDARRFPEKGRGEFESAYVEPNLESPVGRVYLGILPIGVDSDEVVARIAEVVDAEAAAYWADPAADQQIAGRYDLSLIYVNQKNTAGNIGARLKSELLVRVLTGDRSLDDVRSAIDQILGDATRPYPERLKTLIATSLISHGVDLDRLNVMAFVGFPGRAADYIQSSSRVGRSNVGLVCTLFEPSSNLDRSTYLHFHEYHERLYQLVQPVPINRFSEASVSRTFTGIYSALVLNVLAHLKPATDKRGRPIPRSFRRGNDFVRAIEDATVTDMELAELIEESYGIARHGLPAEVETRLQTLIARKVRLARQSIQAGEDFLMYKRLKPAPVSSLRDVQEQIEFKVEFRSRDEVDRVKGY